MSEVIYHKQSVEFLGFLRSQLNGLQGISTLCYELIQNADDVKNEKGDSGVSRIIFDIRDDALWVENDGVFREIDFERMKRIAWGNKREEEGTTGAFGIGFISVYQVTDSPEIFSSGRHWIFRPDEEENKRIAEEQVKTEFTRFRLPWAFEYSPIREELGISPVKREELDQYAQEISQSVRKACLFLKQIRVLEVKRSGDLICQIETSRVQNQVLVQDGNDVEIWTTFEGDFTTQVNRFRQQYGSLIETKRSPLVQVAIPTRPNLKGLLYAFLPSEQATGLPFHINADFYPTPDRKRILFDGSYKAEWNRAAIGCAIQVVAQHIPEIQALFKPDEFWNFLQQIKEASEQDSIDTAFKGFWNPVKETVINTLCVLTQSGELKRPSETIYPDSDSQANCSKILEELGLHIVNPGLRPYRNLLLECGSKRLQISDIIKVFNQKGFNKKVHTQEMPQSLRTLDGWSTFWNALNDLVEKRNEEELGKISIAFGSDGFLWPPCQLLKADSAEDQHLFWQVAPTQIWFDSRDYQGNIPNSLVPELSVERAVTLIGENLPHISTLWEEKNFPIKELVDWFEKRSRSLTQDLKQKLKKYPIWPTLDGRLQPLTNLFLTGDFKDPLQMADFVNVEALGGKRDFLRNELSVSELDFITYVNEYIPFALSPGQLSREKRLGLLSLLAENLGKIRGQNSIKDRLCNLPLVWCGEDVFLPARETYFTDPTFNQLLGDKIHFAQFPPKHEESIRELYRWLGVASEPRTQDILNRIKFLVSEPPDDERIQILEKIFEYLAKQWNSWGETQPEFGQLKGLAWLPGTRNSNRWFKPSEVYSIYRSYLFESQGNFLRFSRPVQNVAKQLIEFLGIESEPSVQQVVDHLLYSSNRGQEVNKEVYTFLNQHADAPEIKTLQDKKCIYLSTGEYIRPQDAFWEEHPFGKYRYQLNSEFRQFQKLFERLGVKNKPNWEDAIEVLLDISRNYGISNFKIDDETKNIVVHCWTILSRTLGENEIQKETIKKRLEDKKTIPDPRQILVAPKNIFLEDRPELGEKFQLIQNNLIKLIQDAWLAMEAAGAQRLSRVVQTELVQCENQREAPEVKHIVEKRLQLIHRIVEANKAKDVKGIDLTRLNDLQIKQADSIRIKLSIRAFGKVESMTETVEAIQMNGNLYFSTSNRKIPWIDISREMSRLLYPESDLPNLGLELKEVLSAETFLEASQTLDQLGYPRFQEFENPLPQGATATLGGSSFEPGNPPLPEGRGVQIQHSSDSGLSGSSKKGGQEQQGYSKRSTSRLISYVIGKESETLKREPAEKTQHRQEIAQIGIEKVMEYERKHGRNPTDMNISQSNHPGYDIESVEDSGEIRYIEVKALSDKWDSSNPVQLTKMEFETARKFKSEFWLYVVEYADDAERIKIYPIQNPAEKVNYYLFDHGWIEIAQIDGTE